MATAKTLDSGDEISTSPLAVPTAADSERDVEIAAFAQTFHPLVRSHCLPCHESYVNPSFAKSDVEAAYEIATTFKSDWPDYQDVPLIDLANPASSRIVLRLQRDEHNCWDSCEDSADQMIDVIKAWDLARKNADDQLVQCDDPEAKRGQRKIRLLSNASYRNTLTDLFGGEIVDAISLPNTVSKSHLFDHLSYERLVQTSHLKAYFETAQRVAGRLWDLGPLNCSAESESDLRMCAKQFLDRYAARLWRRPLSDAQYQDMLDMVGARHNAAQYQPVKQAMTTLLIRLLTAPQFLYRTELGLLAADGTYRLDSWEVASALSYLFWRTYPDAELRKLAAQDQLRNPAIVRQQVERLLRHERASRGLGDFVQLWTRAYQVREMDKRNTAAPSLTPELKDQMIAETTDTFMYMIRQDDAGDFAKLLTAPFTIGSAALANYYGAQLDAGGRLRFNTDERIGLLTQGSLMAGYAYPDASSPIHRGVFVIENILCREFPLPPAVTVPDPDDSKSNRDRFKEHSSREECAICHTQIDGVGFGFERFDGFGRFRTVDNGQPVDASGSLILDGLHHEYEGTRELAQLIAGSQDAKRCFVKQMLRFQIGRLENRPAQTCRAERLYQRFATADFKLKPFLHSLFADPAFLMRH
jgi:hypothetical protein